MNVPNIASNVRLTPSLARDNDQGALAWEALLQARQSLKQKRRYRLWYRLNKVDR